ncbi:MAG: hypothetical protein NTV15_01210, partial [Candidatus Bathyarchaeota archaeon]|nr:hypothetical protein [Candidatus Bathyarchaeota archaeon]
PKGVGNKVPPPVDVPPTGKMEDLELARKKEKTSTQVDYVPSISENRKKTAVVFRTTVRISCTSYRCVYRCIKLKALLYTYICICSADEAGTVIDHMIAVVSIEENLRRVWENCQFFSVIAIQRVKPTDLNEIVLSKRVLRKLSGRNCDTVGTLTMLY